MHTLVALWLSRYPGVGLAVAGTALNGREALAVALKIHPHVVLLDAFMPVVDGLAVLPVLRELLPAARIVVYSGSSETESKAMDAGADAWLCKSSDLQPLLRVLAEQAAAGPSHRSLASFGDGLEPGWGR